MAASKLNYIVVYKNHSQVYGCSSKKIALESPPPEGYTNDDKRILFMYLIMGYFIFNLDLYDLPSRDMSFI